MTLVLNFNACTLTVFDMWLHVSKVEEHESTIR